MKHACYQIRRTCFLTLLLFLTGCFLSSAEDGLTSDGPMPRSWQVAAKDFLSKEESTNRVFTFQEVTNCLYQKSLGGNPEAQGLFSAVLILTSHSALELQKGIELMRASAESGYVPSMTQLGLMYESGQFVRKNYNQAILWFKLAAEKGDAEAQLQLGGCYHYGLGATPDYDAAAMWYRRSAEQTNFIAMKSLGYLLMNGFGLATNVEEAAHWLTRAAKEGNNRRAMFNLGVLCWQKSSDTNFMAEAFDWMKKSAELGDALAAQQFALFYFNGIGVATNLASYRYWRFKAATLGATESQYAMGVAYRTGDGVPKDEENSLVWYRRAAAKKHPSALYDLAVYNLGQRTNREALQQAIGYFFAAAQAGHHEAQFQCAMNCFRGDLGSVNCEDGKRWLNQAAEAGWARAEFILFNLTFNGRAPSPDCPAFTKDTAAAVKWIRRAADHGDFQAQSTLAVMLIQGAGMEKNPAEAIGLLRRAAERGFALAQNDLGFALASGVQGEPDYVEAAKWCELAGLSTTDENILARAKINLRNMRSHLTEGQQLQVNMAVQNFKALPAFDPSPVSVGWQNNPGYQQEDGGFGH